MRDAGLRSINIGIETPDKDIASQSKRVTDQDFHLKQLIHQANNLGIKVNGFYILGFENDTYISCMNTIKYSLNLDTHMARYSVCTPYPGTMYYSELAAKNKIVQLDYTKYNQQTLVFDHDNLNASQVSQLIDKAYNKYYLRPRILIRIARHFLSTILN